MYRDFYFKYSNRKTLGETITFQSLSELAEKNGKRARSDLKKIQRIKDKEIALFAQIDRMKHTKKTKIVSAFVTFETKEQRDEAYKLFGSTDFQRGCFSICPCVYSKNYLIFEESYLNVHDAPAPTNIEWLNMEISDTQKFFRRLLSWGITIILWAISKGFRL